MDARARASLIIFIIIILVFAKSRFRLSYMALGQILCVLYCTAVEQKLQADYYGRVT